MWKANTLEARVKSKVNVARVDDLIRQENALYCDPGGIELWQRSTPCGGCAALNKGVPDGCHMDYPSIQKQLNQQGHNFYRVQMEKVGGTAVRQMS